MIDPTHPLPIMRQAQLLDVSRSSVYYQPQPTSDCDLALMRRIDELHLESPFAGSRMLRDLLAADGFAVGRLHIATLIDVELRFVVVGGEIGDVRQDGVVVCELVDPVAILRKCRSSEHEQREQSFHHRILYSK